MLSAQATFHAIGRDFGLNADYVAENRWNDSHGVRRLGAARQRKLRSDLRCGSHAYSLRLIRIDFGHQHSQFMNLPDRRFDRGPVTIPKSPWRETMEFIESIAHQLFRTARIDVPFLKTIWPERSTSTLAAYLGSLRSLGFLDRGVPTDALQSLARCTRGSKEWNDIVRKQFIRTYEPVLGTAEVFSVEPEEAREAIMMRGGRSGLGADRAVQFFLNGAEELRLDQEGDVDGESDRETRVRTGTRQADRQPPEQDTGDNSGESRSLPYISWSNFEELLRRLAERKPLPRELPPAVLHETMPRLKVTTHSHYRSAMKSLGLVDRRARPTPVLHAMIGYGHGTDEWRSLLRERLARSYGRALGFADAVGSDDETAERKILDWTGYSPGSAKTSVRFLRAALRDTRPDPVLPEPQPEPEPEESQEYAVHRLPWHGRSDPFVVKVPFDLGQAEWRWIDGYIRRWIPEARKKQRK